MLEHFLPLVDGYMPIQLLVEVAGLLLLLTGLVAMLGKAGWRVGLFGKAVGVYCMIWVWLTYRVYPPMPFSVLMTYLVVVLAAILLWVSSSEEYWLEFKNPIVEVLDAESARAKIIRAGAFVLLPCLAGFLTWDSMQIKVEAPLEIRTVGPAPPTSFALHGKEIVLETVKNPYRVNRQGVYDPHYMAKKLVDEKTGWFWEIGVMADAWQSHGDQFLEAAKEGGRIYFQECVLCHGANLSGRGAFSHAFSPIPTNFTDPGTIAQHQEAHTFWRVAGGGINLPPEGFPWMSTMPRMEDHLSTEDIWKVVLFSYWHTGWVPRTWE